MKNQRYNQLDSIRGLAALSVVIYHYLFIFPAFYNNTFGREGYELVNLLKYSPLHIFFSGTQAVMLFFVLSGFVLALPYINRTNQKYSVYITKRISRVYLPYIVSVIVVFSAMLVFSNGLITGLSPWANGRWSEPANIQLLFQHFFLISNFENGKYNPVYWSLVHEMRISIIFPLIMAMVLKYDWKLITITSLGISAFGFIGSYLFKYLGIETDYLFTLYYGITFVFGALLAKHKDIFIKIYNSSSFIMKILFVLLSLILYTFPSWVRQLTFIPIQFLDPPSTIMASIGALMFIVISLASMSIKKILLFKPIHFIGRISYSIYLYHCIPLFILLIQFKNRLPIEGILMLSFFIALVLATCSYFFIERPSIKFGKWASSKIQSKKSKEIHLNRKAQ